MVLRSGCGAHIAYAGLAIIALMLALLIFIGESVRDAFDPRKSFE
jgi:ABC-type microcin C transport system permease subunit YejE